MGRSSLPGVLASAMWLAGCGASYEAALLVTLDVREGLLDEAGGYLVTLVQPNGDSIDGIESKFLKFKTGEQELAVLLEKDVHFTDGEFNARLWIQAVQSVDGPAVAVATQLITVEKGPPMELSLTLLEDPRPISRDFYLTFATDWSISAADRFDTSLRVETWSDVIPTGLTFHVWICEPDCTTGPLVWVGVAGADGTLVGSVGGAPLITRTAQFIVTAEPAEVTGQVNKSFGWPVARGTVAQGTNAGQTETYVEALQRLLITDPRSATGRGVATVIDFLVDHANIHIGNALRNPPTGPYVRDHTGHVIRALVHDLDLPAVGDTDNEPVGITDSPTVPPPLNPPPPIPGWLTILSQDATDAAEYLSGSTGDAAGDAAAAVRACTQDPDPPTAREGIPTIIRAALANAEQLQANADATVTQALADLSDDLQADIDRLNTSFYGPEPDEEIPCSIATVEAMALVVLVPTTP